MVASEQSKTALLSLAVAAVTAIFSACETAEPVYPDTAYGPPPANWQTTTIEYVKSQLKGPYSAHIRLAGEPPQKTAVRTLGGMGKTVPGYVVNVYVNAKNSFGAYVGEKLVPVYFINGQPYYALM